MIGHPSAANRFATVVLPQAMPPVRPIRKPARMCGQRAGNRREVSVDDVVPDDRQPARDREERPEGDLRFLAPALPDQESDAEHRAHQEANTMMGSSICQPIHAPSAAKSLKSP